MAAGGWEISIHSFSEDKRDSLSDEPPYSISIKRADGSTFQLPGQSDILRLLALLLSFSSERWVQYSTIYGRMPARPDGRAISRVESMSMPELRDWPAKDFGTLGSVRCVRLLPISTALSTAPLVIRIWLMQAGPLCDLPPNHRFFGGKKADSLESQLPRVVKEFRMAGRMLNRDEVYKVVRQAQSIGIRLTVVAISTFRKIKVFAHHQYLYHLARLLVLAKLGGSSILVFLTMLRN